MLLKKRTRITRFYYSTRDGLRVEGNRAMYILYVPYLNGERISRIFKSP